MVEQRFCKPLVGSSNLSAGNQICKQHQHVSQPILRLKPMLVGVLWEFCSSHTFPAADEVRELRPRVVRGDPRALVAEEVLAILLVGAFAG